MRRVRIGVNDTPERLSARLDRPVCMLLRANRLYSTAWLLAEREILLPEADFCRKDAGPCPCDMLRLGTGCAAGESERSCALRPKETMVVFAQRTGVDVDVIRRINRYCARPMPGVRLKVPDSRR